MCSVSLCLPMGISQPQLINPLLVPLQSSSPLFSLPSLDTPPSPFYYFLYSSHNVCLMPARSMPAEGALVSLRSPPAFCCSLTLRPSASVFNLESFFSISHLKSVSPTAPLSFNFAYHPAVSVSVSSHPLSSLFWPSILTVLSVSSRPLRLLSLSRLRFPLLSSDFPLLQFPLCFSLTAH